MMDGQDPALPNSSKTQTADRMITLDLVGGWWTLMLAKGGWGLIFSFFQKASREGGWLRSLAGANLIINDLLFRCPRVLATSSSGQSECEGERERHR
jgi:hypothetical protein